MRKIDCPGCGVYRHDKQFAEEMGRPAHSFEFRQVDRQDRLVMIVHVTRDDQSLPEQVVSEGGE